MRRVFNTNFVSRVVYSKRNIIKDVASLFLVHTKPQIVWFP